ncbi:hypothetical protein [Vibrio azureus]|nr:hypothetical protein [Vibrio azureus]
MKFFNLIKADSAQVEEIDSTWEDKYPEHCPLWLNVIGWSFVLAPFFIN